MRTMARLPLVHGSRLTFIALIAFAFIAGAGCASDPNYGGVTSDAGPPVDGNDPAQPPAGVVAAGVRWVGRGDTTPNPGQPRFAWSGTGVAGKFSGAALTAELAISGATQIFKTVVDGTPQAPFMATGGQAKYPLASGLAAGTHTVEVYRQTEAPQGDSRLVGLTVADGALMD